MAWDCYETVRVEHTTGRYYLARICDHDCVTYQCVDEPSTEEFIRYLTDEEVQQRYPSIQSNH